MIFGVIYDIFSPFKSFVPIALKIQDFVYFYLLYPNESTVFKMQIFTMMGLYDALSINFSIFVSLV